MSLSFAGSLGVVLACAALALPVGLALTRRALGGGARGGPERLALSASVGSGLCLLLFGVLSSLGARGTAAALGTVVVLDVAAVVALKGELRAAGRELVGLLSPSSLALVAALGALLSLLPLLLHHAVNPYNDTYTYLGIAEYLHHHPFSRPADPDPYMPLHGMAKLYQDAHLRMGAVYFLALVREVLGVERAIVVYPGVAAWGLTLNVLSIFLLCRWAARLPAAWSLAAAAVAAVWPNSLHFAAGQGFLPQLFGTAFLGLSLALLGRGLASHSASIGPALLLAVAGASLVSAYSELAPFLLLTAAVVLGHRLAGRRARRRPAARLALVTALAFVVLANHEIVRTAQALPGQMQARVGTRLSLSALERLGNLYGLFAAPGWDRNFWRLIGPSRAWLFPLVASAVLALAAVGAVVLMREGRARPVWPVATLVFLAVAAYYAGAVRDPWIPSQRGHGWNLFKLAQWYYPLALVPLVAGLRVLHRRTGRLARAAFVLLPGILVPCALLIHAAEAKRRTDPIRAETGSARPLEELEAFADAAGRLIPGPVVCVRSAGLPVRLRQMVVYYLHPRGVSSDWRNDDWIYPYLAPANRLMTAPCRAGIVSAAALAADPIAGLPANLVLDRGDGPGRGRPAERRTRTRPP